jgi:hypothetical protein
MAWSTSSCKCGLGYASSSVLVLVWYAALLPSVSLPLPLVAQRSCSVSLTMEVVISLSDGTDRSLPRLVISGKYNLFLVATSRVFSTHVIIIKFHMYILYFLFCYDVEPIADKNFLLVRSFFFFICNLASCNLRNNAASGLRCGVSGLTTIDIFWISWKQSNDA